VVLINANHNWPQPASLTIIFTPYRRVYFSLGSRSVSPTVYLHYTTQTHFISNKKYVLWNTGICPVASKVGHVTLATPPLGSFIVPYVVLAMVYPTKKNEESSFIRLKVMESEVPKFKK